MGEFLIGMGDALTMKYWFSRMGEAPHNQSMNIFRPFIGVDRLQVDNVTNYMTFIRDTITTHDIHGNAAQ